MSLAYLFDSNIQFQDRSGNNNVNGFLRVYIDNTDDRAVTYKDFNGTLNQADIRLDNNGRAVVIVDDSKTYRLEVYGTTGVLLWTLYPISPKATGINETLEALVAAVKSHTIAIEGLALGKKNKQQAKVISGTPTQTVKSISQNADGEITVEFEEIDFPYNINICSPDDSIEVGTPVVDPERKEETIPLSVKRPGLVKAYPEDTNPGTLIDKLEVEDTVQEPEEQTLLEVVPTDGKVAINEDNLRRNIDSIYNSIDGIVETIDEMDVDSVPRVYLASTLNQSPGDNVSTRTTIDVFSVTAIDGDCFEFEQTTTIDDTPFGYVWIEPGTYLINAAVTLQWVGNPRGTFIAKVGSVMGENFDFSQEQEIMRQSTKVVTIPSRMKLAVNVTYDKETPVMGFWVQSMQVVKLAGGMSQTNIIHDNTLVGQGSVADPLGVDEAKVSQSTLAGNLAPAFDPTRTEPTKYLAGESIVYEGVTYTFKVDHYGAWNASDVEKTPNVIGSVPIVKSTDIVNFAISDKHGNIVLAVSNGHVITRFFNSKTTPRFDADAADFAVSDGSGNRCLVVYDGHLITKHFDSRKLQEFYRSSKNYGKSVGVFGGSLSVYPESQAAKNLWRKYLNFDIADYGVGGAGFSSLQGTTPIPTQVDNAASKDIYILWASTNDYTHSREIGSYSDYTYLDNYDSGKLTTQCGGINYCIKKLYEKNPLAEIYFFTGIDFFSQEGGYNPFTQQTNLLGYTYQQYVDAQKKCCELFSIPVLDQNAISGLNIFNYTHFFKTDNLHMKEVGYEKIAMQQVQFLANGL